MMKKISLLGALLACLTGCVHNRITNLTASQQPRTATHQYLIECEWRSNLQAIRPLSVQPYVVSGFEFFEMRPVLRTTNRWETFVSVPDHQTAVTYHFKVDYDYNRFGQPGRGSIISPEYKLRIVEK